MRVFLVFFLLSGLLAVGWWLKQGGAERWPNRNVVVQNNNLNITLLPSTTTTNTSNVNVAATPDLPQPLNVHAVASGTEITLNWDAVDDAYGYALTRNGTFIGVVYGTQFLDFSLTANTSYTYTIAAVNKLNIPSTSTASTSATTPPTVATITNTNTATPTSNTNSVKPVTNTNSTIPVTNTNSTKSTNTNSTTQPKNTNTSNGNTNTVVVPSAPACGQGGACTASDVANHNTRSNCWVYLSPINKTYNITSYVASGSNHPGGDVIVPFCGKNIYGPFSLGTNGGKRHSTTALNSVLQAYYIGPFTP